MDGQRGCCIVSRYPTLKYPVYKRHRLPIIPCVASVDKLLD